MMNTNSPQTGVNDGSNLKRLIDVGIALSAEKDHDALMEIILVEAKAIYNADGGTLYLRRDDSLAFAIMQNDSMNIAMGGTTGDEIPFPPLLMYDPDTGKPNHNSVATHVALTGKLVNTDDAYETDDFDFSGARAFDERAGYRSTSFLTIPLKNYEKDVVGVLQLINARTPDSSEVTPFSPAAQPLVEALASQAAIALDNQLLLEAQKNLLESFIRLIATAIDRKSPYTGGHCQRVPAITEMMADAACFAKDGPFKDFDLDEEERYELMTAAWLHDCGKVTTPEYIMDKATKLETVVDRIEIVRARITLMKREAELEHTKGTGQPGADMATLDQTLKDTHAQLDDNFEFLEGANIGGEFMDPAKIERVKQIAKLQWRDVDGSSKDLLNKNEIHNLSITRGTLTAEDRTIINDHIVVTIDMLEQLPFPKNLKRVPEYAGGHHEKMDGTGYPRGLKRDEMSIPARMMAIADIYEALTAADRPYKKAKTISESLGIMKKMNETDHIDPDLFQLFIESGVYRKYAEEFLDPDQIDEVDEAQILGRAA